MRTCKPTKRDKTYGVQVGLQEKEECQKEKKTFKARLVANGYTQKASFDYDETFSPVAMLKSIRILLSTAVALDYEI